MNDFGALCIITSFAILIFSIVQTSYGIWKQDKQVIELGRYTLMANSAIILLAFIVLLVQLFRTDLSNYYVVMHSNEHLPLFYRLTGIWSGSSGSLLFWNLLLSLFTFIVLWQTKDLTQDRIPVLNLTLAVISAFFLILLYFIRMPNHFENFNRRQLPAED